MCHPRAIISRPGAIIFRHWASPSRRSGEFWLPSGPRSAAWLHFVVFSFVFVETRKVRKSLYRIAIVPPRQIIWEPREAILDTVRLILDRQAVILGRTAGILGRPTVVQGHPAVIQGLLGTRGTVRGAGPAGTPHLHV